MTSSTRLSNNPYMGVLAGIAVGGLLLGTLLLLWSGYLIGEGYPDATLIAGTAAIANYFFLLAGTAVIGALVLAGVDSRLALQRTEVPEPAEVDG